MIRIPLALIALALPAHAEGALIFKPQETESCLTIAASPEDRRACIGVAAALCMAETPGGDSTVGMGGCLSAELDYWDLRLNSSYRLLRSRTKALDEQMKADGLQQPSMAAALLDAQRAWIPYRDATCNFEMSQWGTGTGRGPALLSCLMRLTAEQTLYLEEVMPDG